MSRPSAPSVLLRLAAFAVAAIAAALGNRATAQRSRDDPSSFPSMPEMGPLLLPRHPVFFPPNPPPLGRPVGRGATPGDGRPPAPPELAPYANEIFYPALGARLISRSLKEPQRQQLDGYRATKLALQNELRTELLALRDADPAARATVLATLARKQAPKLAQLEQDAEQLRRDLIVKEHAWNAQREWRLGQRDRRGFSPIEIAQVMRSYAFFEPGLLPAQRRLLREISLELWMAAEDPDKAAAAQPHVFFPPEPARVAFPDALSAEAAAKLAIFQTKKSVLKKELYDAIYQHDGQTFGFLTGNTIKALVAKQVARLVELEEIAEQVRRLLRDATVPSTAPERAPVPLALMTRINELITAYSAAQTDAAARVDAILAQSQNLPMQASYQFEPERMKFVVVPTRMAARQSGSMKKIEAARAQISAVADDYGRKLAELLNERAAIRVAIGEALGTSKDETIDQVLFDAMRVVHAKQTESSYDEYRIAVFEPGLSPEQRRLLFDGVIERLELPLPRGEFQPTRRNRTW